MTPLREPRGRVEQIRSPALLVWMVQGVDVLIENIDQQPASPSGDVLLTVNIRGTVRVAGHVPSH
jgi:hypothetical protein